MENLAKIQPESFEAINTLNLSDAWNTTGCYESVNLFLTYFNTIPNLIKVVNLDFKKANDKLLKNHAAEITNYHYIKQYSCDEKNEEYTNIYYTLFDDLLIHFNNKYSYVLFLFRKTDTIKVESLIDEIKRCQNKKRKESEVYLLIENRIGIYIEKMEIAKSKISIDENYNDDLKKVDAIILKRLLNQKDKGLILLHGKPGTGKTSYIRYLISKVKKKVIFLPPNMASIITNPHLISILINNPDSIFVIEDAENIILDRNKNGNSSVSALLNISDGLLSDCLNIQIICSFNTDISQVDNALMRKGRLIAKYEFKELEVRKAQALSDKLGFSSKMISPMPLSAIYNQDEANFYHKQCFNKIGFKTVI